MFFTHWCAKVFKKVAIEDAASKTELCLIRLARNNKSKSCIMSHPSFNYFFKEEEGIERLSMTKNHNA